jgi:hypothetical protein
MLWIFWKFLIFSLFINYIIVLGFSIYVQDWFKQNKRSYKWSMNHKNEYVICQKEIEYVISTCISEEIAEEHAEGGGGERLLGLFTAYLKKLYRIPPFLDGFPNTIWTLQLPSIPNRAVFPVCFDHEKNSISDSKLRLVRTTSFWSKV